MGSKHQFQQNKPPKAMNMTKIVVFNFASNTTIAQIAALFVKYGDVTLVRMRWRPRRRYCIVQMPNDFDAEKAIRELDGRDWGGQPLQVEICTF